ncbi:DEAD/DEAH box helicase family protein [Paraclostridium bifermentans]|uniref:DEAD/DEAH box helicase family protein n=1 Tax=Paraclostridium bifermentans TaxID=1490 RepID=UPI00290BDD20|nr:DEAD/DEAH box helicase family protein [Paraclostridium bifermentans]MDU3337941.1 DEAD/DEAH box helicase family protein [Paraclostridium bifermentans]
MEKLWLSEAMKDKKLEYGVLNLINAPAGSGKTTFIFKDLIENHRYYGINELRLNKMIYICDTSSLKNKVLKEDVTKKYEYGDLDNILNDNWENGKVIVMTYAMLGTLLNNSDNKVKILNSDVIIFDEVHQVPIYSYKFDDKIEDSKKRNGVYSNILKNMPDMIKKSNCIGLSATMFLHSIKKFQENGIMTNTIFSDVELKHVKSYNFEPKYINYTFNILKEYVTHNELFKNTKFDYKKHNKLLIYTHKIQQAEKFKQYLLENNINTEWICSLNAKDDDGESRMNEYQHKLRNYIIENGEVYADIQCLIINAAYETGIDIFDENKEFKCVIVNSKSKTTQIQARNRIRHDIENLYVLSDVIYDDRYELWCKPEYDGYRIVPGDPIYMPNLTTYINDKYVNRKLIKDLKGEMIKKYSIIQCGKEDNEFTFESIIEDIRKISKFKVYRDEDKGGIWIFKRDEFISYLKTNGLKYSDEVAKGYIKYLNKEKDKCNYKEEVCNFIEILLGKQLYKNDLYRKNLIELVNARRDGKLLKNVTDINSKLKNNKIQFFIKGDNVDKKTRRKYWTVEKI